MLMCALDLHGSTVLWYIWSWSFALCFFDVSFVRCLVPLLRFRDCAPLASAKPAVPLVHRVDIPERRKYIANDLSAAQIWWIQVRTKSSRCEQQKYSKGQWIKELAWFPKKNMKKQIQGWHIWDQQNSTLRCLGECIHDRMWSKASFSWVTARYNAQHSQKKYMQHAYHYLLPSALNRKFPGSVSASLLELPFERTAPRPTPLLVVQLFSHVEHHALHEQRGLCCEPQVPQKSQLPQLHWKLGNSATRAQTHVSSSLRHCSSNVTGTTIKKRAPDGFKDSSTKNEERDVQAVRSLYKSSVNGSLTNE